MGRTHLSFNEYYYSDNYSCFEEWLNLIYSKDNSVYPFCKIPYEEWLNDYLSNIHQQTIDEVKKLLRHLLFPVNRKIDLSNYEHLRLLKNSSDIKLKELMTNITEDESFYRIENGQDAWEGLTWILDFLPSRPYKAIKALEYYLSAQSNLPDDRITGILQCIEIILEKFIHYENPLEKILNLTPEEFEWLIETLYESMGYETTLTPATNDGGKDIIATINRVDGKEIVYVECKLYRTTKLKIDAIRNLGYVMMKNNINRAVLFCTGYVNDKIKNYDNRIQVWSYGEINLLLNAHMGTDWCERLDILLNNKRRKYKKQ